VVDAVPLLPVGEQPGWLVERGVAGVRGPLLFAAAGIGRPGRYDHRRVPAGRDVLPAARREAASHPWSRAALLDGGRVMIADCRFVEVNARLPRTPLPARPLAPLVRQALHHQGLPPDDSCPTKAARTRFWVDSPTSLDDPGLHVYPTAETDWTQSLDFDSSARATNRAHTPDEAAAFQAFRATAGTGRSALLDAACGSGGWAP